MRGVDGPALGPSSAKVTLVAYSDFQCPYCARARKVVEQLHELYPKELRIVFRHFPLAQHAQARPAAEAAECAEEQGKFWPYHDLLFDNPSALAKADLERYATDVKLDPNAFTTCLGSDRPKAVVAAAEAEGKRFGVQGTPALFLNGMKLIGLLPLPLLQALIDKELSITQ
jgi:protein-disulfide isomerase